MGQVDRDNIPVLLRQFRRRLGLKQEAMAEHLGLSQGYYSRLENGRWMPSTQVYDRIIALVSNPGFQDVALRWRKSVQYSHTPASMIFADRGTVRLLEISQGFRAMGGVYASLQTGDVLDHVLGEDFDRQVSELRALGAFDGELAFVRILWRSAASGALTYMKSITTILPDESYRYVFHNQNVEISEDEYNAHHPSAHITVLER